MTAKQKAKELLDKFRCATGVEGRECALICVREKIDELQNISDAGIGIPNTYLVARMIYLKKVEQEIEKL